mmetsp:Transcript_3951/g.3877  ORF Transcript_3951/g.3877 Transcript_3951/m.3877 type:complete len:178 (+) Transcript_3951:733-1266(+)
MSHLSQLKCFYESKLTDRTNLKDSSVERDLRGLNLSKIEQDEDENDQVPTKERKSRRKSNNMKFGDTELQRAISLKKGKENKGPKNNDDEIKRSKIYHDQKVSLLTQSTARQRYNEQEEDMIELTSSLCSLEKGCSDEKVANPRNSEGQGSSSERNEQRIKKVSLNEDLNCIEDLIG